MATVIETPDTEPEIDKFTGLPKRPPLTSEQERALREPKAIVEISTVLEREFITVDDKRYNLASWHDFGIVKRQQLMQDSAEFNRLWASANLAEAQQERLAQLLDELFSVAVVKLPATVAKKLDDANRESIVMAFTLAPVREMSRAAQQAQLQQDTQARDGSTTAS